MRPVSEIRRDRLRSLCEEMGGQAAVARMIEKDRRQVNAWLTDPNKKGSKALRDTTARWIERKCLKRAGWLDHEQREDSVKIDDLLEPASQSVGFSNAILLKASQWVETEELAGDVYMAEGRLLRVLHVAQLLLADGGDFTAMHAFEFTSSANERNAITRGKHGKQAKGRAAG